MVALCHWWDEEEGVLSSCQDPGRHLLPDEFYEPLPGGFTHVLLINSHNLVTSQELVFSGASCRGEEKGMRAWGHCWESSVLREFPVSEKAEVCAEACRRLCRLSGAGGGGGV